jgi:hypothetical protein
MRTVQLIGGPEDGRELDIDDSSDIYVERSTDDAVDGSLTQTIVTIKSRYRVSRTSDRAWFMR